MPTSFTPLDAVQPDAAVVLVPIQSRQDDALVHAGGDDGDGLASADRTGMCHASVATLERESDAVSDGFALIRELAALDGGL